jgi:SsrA-binding protein
MKKEAPQKNVGLFCFYQKNAYFCIMSTLILNRKAKFDYEFLDKYNAGIQLLGSEVKAIKRGEANVVDAFCYFNGNELFIKNFVIRSNDKFFEHDPNRDKKLLLKRQELNRIKNKLEKHLTIVPVVFYLSERNKIKVEIAIAKGKKNHDKRESIKAKEAKKEMTNYEI